MSSADVGDGYAGGKGVKGKGKSSRSGRSARVTAAYTLAVGEDRRLHAGYLTKQGGKWKTWKLRWMVLTSSSLRYYVNEDEAEKGLKGEIPVANITFVRKHVDNDDIDRANCIMLGTIGRTFYLAAESAADYDLWLSWLCLVCTVPPPPPDHVGAYKLFREGYEQGHKATMHRYLVRGNAPQYPFDALADVGVPPLDSIVFPPMSVTTKVETTLLKFLDARFSVKGSVSMARDPETNVWQVVAEDWSPSISAFIEANGLDIDPTVCDLDPPGASSSSGGRDHAMSTSNSTNNIAGLVSPDNSDSS